MTNLYEPKVSYFYNVNRERMVYRVGKQGTKAYLLFDEEHMEMLHDLIGKALGKNQ